MSLDRAHRAKRRRASALLAVAQGRLPVREAVWDGHKALVTCPIHVVLEAAPRLGPEGTRKILERAGVWPLLPLGKLSELERQAIVDLLPERVP